MWKSPNVLLFIIDEDNDGVTIACGPANQIPSLSVVCDRGSC